MEPKTPRIERFEKWEHAKAFLGRFDRDWVFRGQGNNDWSLTTTLERAAGESLIAFLGWYEEWIREEFKRGAHHFLSPHHVPAGDIDWLSLMQHHGAPTRLLDFSYSPYVAAYFALERASQWCSVWVIHSEFLRTAGGLLADAEEDFFTLPYYDSGYLTKVLSSGKPGVFPVEPYKKNDRLLAQQGLFLCPVDSRRTFEDNLRATLTCNHLDSWDHPIFRVDISREARLDALDDLRKMNVTRATLFPGLDGFAQSLSFKLFPDSEIHK